MEFFTQMIYKIANNTFKLIKDEGEYQYRWFNSKSARVIDRYQYATDSLYESYKNDSSQAVAEGAQNSR